MFATNGTYCARIKMLYLLRGKVRWLSDGCGAELTEVVRFSLACGRVRRLKSWLTVSDERSPVYTLILSICILLPLTDFRFAC